MSLRSEYAGMAAEQLADAIDAQKRINRALLSDVENPHNIQRTATELRNRADTIADELHIEIQQAEARLNSLRESYLHKIKDAQNKATAAEYRRDHTRELYADGCELIEKMQARMHVLDNGGKIAKARELSRKLAELQSQLPAHLRGKSLEEIQAAFKEAGV